MSIAYTQALQAAQSAAGAQHYPQAALYMVATPIGNLADISLRALHVLQLADTIACEDTRHSQALLRAYGLEKPAAHWLALHQHNEAEAAGTVLERLRSGQRVAYLSDAGTPAVSDPGGRLAQQVQAAGLRLVPIPGPSSVTALLSVAGMTPQTSDEAAGFIFIGFLPTKHSERSKLLAGLAQQARPYMLLEAPHRIDALAHELAPLGPRRLTIGRELTKQFEEIATLPAQQLPQWLDGSPQRQRGEFALLVHAAEGTVNQAEIPGWFPALLAQLPLKSAVQLAVQISGLPRNTLYQAALQLKAPDQPDAESALGR